VLYIGINNLIKLKTFNVETDKLDHVIESGPEYYRVRQVANDDKPNDFIVDIEALKETPVNEPCEITFIFDDGNKINKKFHVRKKGNPYAEDVKTGKLLIDKLTLEEKKESQKPITLHNGVVLELKKDAVISLDGHIVQYDAEEAIEKFGPIGKNGVIDIIGDIKYTDSKSKNTPSYIVTGRVLDAFTNQPLIGANIVVEGTDIGTITDLKGNYKLEIAYGNHNVVASYTGYKTLDNEVSNKCDLTFSLVRETPGTGGHKINRENDPLPSEFNSYLGDADKRALITVNEDDLGRNSEVDLASTKPMIIIDGKQKSKDDFEQIKPEDISKINVFKGEKAIEKYGKKGEYGVLEIETKRSQDNIIVLRVIDGIKETDNTKINNETPLKTYSLSPAMAKEKANIETDAGLVDFIFTKENQDLEKKMPIKFRLLGNPVLDGTVKFEYTMDELYPIEATVRNIVGKKLKSKKITPSSNKGITSIDLNGLTNGIYLLHLQSNGIGVTQQFIISN
jgi:hypothetical protein